MTSQRMTRQRIFGLLLICVQAVALSYLSQTVVFSVFIVTVAGIGLFTNYRLDMTGDRATRLAISLGILCLIKYVVTPYQFRFDRMFIQTQLAYAVAEFLLLRQAMHFILKRPEDRLPLMLPGFGAVAMIRIADVQVSWHERVMFQVLTICFAVLAALYFGSCRKISSTAADRGRAGRTIAATVVLLLAVIIGRVSANGLYLYERNLENLIIELLAPAFDGGSIGFTNNARLGNIARQKSLAENQIALRAFSTQPPGYLRGNAFDEYERSQWRSRSGREDLRPLKEVPSGIPSLADGERLYEFARSESRHLHLVELWPNRSLAGNCFTPLGANYLKTTEEASVDEHGTFETNGRFPENPYSAFVSIGYDATGLTDQQRQQLTQVPDDIDPRVKQLAAKLVAGCSTTSERITVVEQYFHDNYRYNLGISVEGNVDPLTYFLLEKPAAHCEYFASGAAVLLRLAVVPCRYLTGFVATERNPYGGYWVARNKDAHAWVEAYDEQRGWVIVEATPAVGIPTPSASAWTTLFGEYVRDRVQMLRVMMQHIGLESVGRALMTVFASAPGLLGLTAIGIVIVLALQRRFWRKSPTRRENPTLEEFHRLLREMDRRLRQLHLERRPGETLHQFAIRTGIERGTEPVAEWYRLYASLRYSGQLNRESVAVLRDALIDPRPPKE